MSPRLRSAVLAAAAYAILAAPLLDVPVRWDEVELARQAEAIADHGVPRIAFADSEFVTFERAQIRADGADIGLGHPPLYIYVASVPIALAGRSDEAVRAAGYALGVGGTALVVLVTFGLARRRAMVEEQALAPAWIAGAAVASSPFWLEGTMRVDIDGALLSVLTLATVAAAVLVDRDAARAASLTILMTALLWAKPPGFVLAVAGLVVFYALGRHLRRLLEIALCAGAAVLIFAMSWGAYAALVDVPWDYSWVAGYRDRDEAAAGRSAFAIANTVRFNVGWIGFPLLALAAVSVAALVQRVARRAPLLAADAFLLTALTAGTFYILLWGEPGKYTVMLVPLVAVPAGLDAINVLGRLRLDRRIVGVAGVLFLGFLLVGDAVTAPASRAEGGFAGALSDPRLPRLVFGMALLLAVIVVSRGLSRCGVRHAIVAGALIALPAAQLAQYAYLLRGADSTLMLAPKDESGFRETVSWLRERVRPGDLIVAPREVGYYTRPARTIPLDREGTFSLNQVPNALATRPVRFVVSEEQKLVEVTSQPGGVSLGRRYRLERRFGSFVVYARRP